MGTICLVPIFFLLIFGYYSICCYFCILKKSNP